jgi:hypothetical protein
MTGSSGVSSTLQFLDPSPTLWNTGSSAFADDDGRVCGVLAFIDMTSPSRRAMRPSFAKKSGLLKIRGRRESRVPVAPAAAHVE